MSPAAELRRLPRAALRARLLEGHPVDPGALEGWAYRGTVLGAPPLLERATWTTFQKTFHRDASSGRLVGWNVRVHQDGVGAPSRPRESGGAPTTAWPFEVRVPEPGALPRGFDRGLVIDYGPFAGALGSMRWVRDPLVALEPGSADRLLGVSVAAVGSFFVETPTWFLLEREHRLTHVPPPFAPAPLLRAFERRWAEALFGALVGRPVEDRPGFWAALAAHGPAYLAPGLRLAVHGLTFLPVVMRGFGRPFYALDDGARARCVEALAAHPRTTVRQLLSTLKVLACLALFEDPAVRAEGSRAR